MKFYFIFLLTITNLFSKDNYFEKFYPYSEAHSVIETDHANYLFTAILQQNDSTFYTNVIQLNHRGQILWTKSFPGIRSEKYYRTDIVENEQGFLLLSTFKENSLKKLVLTQLDKKGSEIWSNTFNDSSDHVSCELLALSDGGYLISARKKNYIIHLIKCQPDGKIMWQAEFLASSFRNDGNQVIETSDGALLLVYKRNMVKLCMLHGHILWDKEISGWPSCVVQDSVGNFYLSGRNEVIKTDPEGNELLAFSIDCDPYKMLLKKNTLIFCSEKILWTTVGGENIHLEPADGVLYEVITTSDGGYIYAGKNNTMRKSGWILKTDKTGYYQSLNITYPDSGSYIIAGEAYSFHWRARNIDKVNLSLTTDGGFSYKKISENAIADSGHINFTVPFDTSKKCLLYIESVNNPHLNDISDGYFTIGTQNYFEEILVNNMNYFFTADGGPIDFYSQPRILLWPDIEEPDKSLVFDEGLVFSGKVNNDFYAGGQFYGSSLNPGYILENGTPVDRTDERIRIWKTAPDWQTLPDGIERDMLEFNVMNWPAFLGAPFNDTDNDGIYNPLIDSPQFMGDELYWFITNDYNEYEMDRIFGSVPHGLEIQHMIYAFRSAGNQLDDVLFKKYVIKNKGTAIIEDFALGYWVDVELGGPVDNFTGCDTLLDLGYAYNAENSDPVYGDPPPAFGIMILQGPVIESSPRDSAYFNAGWIKGYKNAAMDAFLMFTCSSMICSPHRGEAGEWYNVLHGFDTYGAPIINPLSGKQTRFRVPGDPVAGTGWYEGPGWPNGPKDGARYMSLGSGSFTFAPGDSQEFVIAMIAALGKDRLDSVTELKRKAAAVRKFYYTDVLPTAIACETISRQPGRFELRQNYPNPFNPETIIEYSVRAHGHVPQRVTLIIYDALGREIKTLVNKKQTPGIYKVTFDASAFASGIYYYRLTAGTSTNLFGQYAQTRKMLFLK